MKTRHRLDKGGYITTRKYPGNSTRCAMTGEEIKHQDIAISFSNPHNDYNEWVSLEGLRILEQKSLSKLENEDYGKFGYFISLLKEEDLNPNHICCFCGDKHEFNNDFISLRISSGRKSTFNREVCIHKGCIKEFFKSYKNKLPKNYFRKILIYKI